MLPENSKKLNAILAAVDNTFRAHDADNHDRIDVLAKLTSVAICFYAPDRDRAIDEFIRMVRGYFQPLDTLAAKPESTA